MTRHRFTADDCQRGAAATRARADAAFWRTTKVVGDCWEWTGVTNQRTRRPYLTRFGRRIYAYRYAYELVNGPIPAGMSVCHRCDNPPCINPAHLFLGTSTDNHLDMVRKGRSVRGERQPGAKLTEAAVRDIKRRGATTSAAALGREFGVSDAAIRLVLRGINWAWVA